MHTGEHCLQAVSSSMALSQAVACGARRGARRAEVRRNGEEGKGKGVGLLFAPSQRIRRVAHTWGSNTRVTSVGAWRGRLARSGRDEAECAVPGVYDCWQWRSGCSLGPVPSRGGFGPKRAAARLTTFLYSKYSNTFHLVKYEKGTTKDPKISKLWTGLDLIIMNNFSRWPNFRFPEDFML
jgi:hypothetical protein